MTPVDTIRDLTAIPFALTIHTGAHTNQFNQPL